MKNKNWLDTAIIYQIYLGRWEGVSKGNEIIHHDDFGHLAKRDWKKLIDMGINCFYFLGIWENEGELFVMEENGRDLNPEKYPRLPSPFAITNHKKVNKMFGDGIDFRVLVKKIQSLGGKVIVDFVPNHTGRNHPWINEHPHYYVQTNNQFEAEFSGDVYKLNYANPELRKEMIEVLDAIGNLGVDGVRVDMAHLVTSEFWTEAIKKIKEKYEGFVFIAEAYANSKFDYSNIHALYKSGFDAIYDDALFDSMTDVIRHKKDIGYIEGVLKSLKTNQLGLIVNYFFNHDDPPLKNNLESEDLNKVIRKYFEVLLGLVLFVPDCAFIYNGSLLGKTHRLAHHWFEPLAKHFIETEKDVSEEISKMFKLRSEMSKVQIGAISDVGVKNGILYFKKKKYICMFNLGESEKTIEGFGEIGKGWLHELNNGDEIGPGKMEVFWEF